MGNTSVVGVPVARQLLMRSDRIRSIVIYAY
jgi:hypothetical protein